MRKQIFDCKQDVLDYYSELQHQCYNDSWREFIDKRGTGQPQHWSLMRSGVFIKLVRRAYKGILTEEDKAIIDEYQELILYNYIKLCFNTMMVGHDAYDPVDEVLQYDLIPEGITNRRRIECMTELCCDWIADDAFSDYGLSPIAKLIVPLFIQKNYCLKVQIMSLIISITHQRGALSGFFIEGGRKTEQQIDVYEPKESHSFSY